MGRASTVGTVSMALCLCACGPGLETSTTTGGGTTTSSTSSSDAADDGTTSRPASTTTDTGASSSGTTGGTTTSGGPTFFPACEGPLTDSLLAWEAAVATAGGSHGFAVLETLPGGEACFDPEDPACALTTTMSVLGGQIVGRTLEVQEKRGVEPGTCPAPFVENDADLGTNPGGFPVSTMSDVYAQCCALAQEQGGYWIDGFGLDYFPGDVWIELDEDGFLATCSRRYCEFCGCTDLPHFEIDGLFIGR